MEIHASNFIVIQMSDAKADNNYRVIQLLDIQIYKYY